MQNVDLFVLLTPTMWRIHTRPIYNLSFRFACVFSALLIRLHSHYGFYAPLTFTAYLSELKDYDQPLPAHMKQMQVKYTAS